MPYLTDWKSAKDKDQDFTCRNCKSDDIWYRIWESPDEAHEDYKYECRNCGLTWWVEDADY